MKVAVFFILTLLNLSNSTYAAQCPEGTTISCTFKFAVYCVDTNSQKVYQSSIFKGLAPHSFASPKSFKEYPAFKGGLPGMLNIEAADYISDDTKQIYLFEFAQESKNSPVTGKITTPTGTGDLTCSQI